MPAQIPSRRRSSTTRYPTLDEGRKLLWVGLGAGMLGLGCGVTDPFEPQLPASTTTLPAGPDASHVTTTIHPPALVPDAAMPAGPDAGELMMGDWAGPDLDGGR